MYTGILIFLAMICAMQSEINSQPVRQWEQRYGSSTNQIQNLVGLESDDSGNVYVTATMSSSTLTDIVTLKYRSDGTLLWSRTFARQIEDRAIDMALDSKGNICVTGLTENLTGTYDIVTIKYNTNGDSLWVRIYNGPSATTMDQPVAIFVDNQDNIIVGGFSSGVTPLTSLTMKYTPEGDTLWIGRIVTGGTAIPIDVAADLNGNVFLYRRGVVLSKYSPAGSLQWSKTIQGFNAAETNRTLLTDSAGNIYLGATKWTATFDDFALIKFAANGDTLWTRIYNGLGGSMTNHDDVNAIAFDSYGNIILGGTSNNVSTYYFSTLKYSSEGNLYWEKTFNAPVNGFGVNDIHTDTYGNIYVTGGSWDIWTMKYSNSGDSLWRVKYDGPSSLNDQKSLITGDESGNILVAAISRESISPSYSKIALIKYSQSMLNIKVIPQGFYNNTTGVLNMRDTMVAFLYNSSAPFVLIDSARSIIDSVTFFGSFSFTNAVSGNYYISVRHRNSLETWSKSGGESYTAGSIMNYDFTSTITQSFGNNLVQLKNSPLLFAVYGGDVNLDGVIDGADASIIDNDAFNFASGYVASDVTGDRFVDASDASTVDNNAWNFVGLIRP